MKLKRSDIELMMRYIEKEKPEFIDVVCDNFCVLFRFTDAEHRDCTIKLFESLTNTTPELTKSMKLYTRFKETKKKEEDNE